MDRTATRRCRLPLVTDSVVGERATTYLVLVAKGLHPVGIIPSSEVAMVGKIVWEAGSAARAPDWNVLPPDRCEGAIRAFAGRR